MSQRGPLEVERDLERRRKANHLAWLRANAPTVFLVMRQSDDCAPKMKELLGATWTLADADELRDYLFRTKGIRTHVEWLHPEPPGEGKGEG